MSLRETLWLLLIAGYTIYQIPSTGDMYEMLGMLTAGVLIGILPIYIGRKLEKKKAL